MRRLRARAQDITEIALSLPEVEQTTSWGDRPTFAVRGKAFIIFRGARPDAVDEDGNRLTDVVVLHCSPDDKQALVDDPATPFFTTAHFNGYNAVLIRESRLGEISRDELAEVITDAWLTRAPKRLAKQWLVDRDTAAE